MKIAVELDTLMDTSKMEATFEKFEETKEMPNIRIELHDHVLDALKYLCGMEKNYIMVTTSFPEDKRPMITVWIEQSEVAYDSLVCGVPPDGEKRKEFLLELGIDAMVTRIVADAEDIPKAVLFYFEPNRDPKANYGDADNMVVVQSWREMGLTLRKKIYSHDSVSTKPVSLTYWPLHRWDDILLETIRRICLKTAQICGTGDKVVTHILPYDYQTAMKEIRREVLEPIGYFHVQSKVDEPEDVIEYVKGEDVGAVYVEYREAHTDFKYDVGKLGRLLKQECPDVLLVVDAVDSIGALPLFYTDWNIDVLLGSYSRGIGCPPETLFLIHNENIDFPETGRPPTSELFMINFKLGPHPYEKIKQNIDLYDTLYAVAQREIIVRLGLAEKSAKKDKDHDGKRMHEIEFDNPERMLHILQGYYIWPDCDLLGVGPITPAATKKFRFSYLGTLGTLDIEYLRAVISVALERCKDDN